MKSITALLSFIILLLIQATFSNGVVFERQCDGGPDDYFCCILNFNDQPCGSIEIDASYLVDIDGLFEETNTKVESCPNISSQVDHSTLNVATCTGQIYQIWLFELEGCNSSGQNHNYLNVQANSCIELGFAAASYHIGLVDPDDRANGGTGCDTSLGLPC